MAESSLPRDPEVLLALDDFVRTLARCLVADANDADDIAQQTWIVALGGGRTGPSARAWLAGIARNVASKLRRKKLRVARRELAAARDERVPSNDAVREREAARREVVEAVLALDEPYRAAVLLRFLDGLPPREVARRAGVPVETIRTRIKRGIERVRAELDHRHDGDRKAWCSALLPLTVPEAGTGGAVIASGVLWMAKVKTVAAALGVAALSLAVWALVRGEGTRGDDGATGPAPAGSEALARSAVPAPTPDTEMPASAPLTRTMVAPPVEATGSLLVRVVRQAGIRGSEPVPDMELRLVPKGPERTPFDVSHVVTDAGGLATFAGLAAGPVVVTSAFGESGTAEIRSGLRAELTLENRSGQYAEGIVVDLRDVPVAGAEVRVFRGGRDYPSWTVGRTAADGTFSIRALFETLEARAKGYSPSARYRTDSDNRQLRIVLGPPSGRLVGRVVDTRGRGVANALVLVGTEGTPGEEPGSYGYLVEKLNDQTFGLPVQPGCFRTDADGRFHGDDLPPGQHAVTARGPGSAAWHGEVEIYAGRESTLLVALQSGASLEGTVRDAAGTPVAGVQVAHGAWDALGTCETSTNADGTYLLTGLPPGPLRVAARSAELGKVLATVEIRHGQRNTWSPTLPPGAMLRGSVLGEDGAPVARSLVEAATAGWSRGVHTDERGRFEIRGCPDAPLELRVREKDGRHPSAVRKDVRAGGEDIVIRIRAEERATVTIHGRVLGIDDKPVSGASVAAFTSAQREGSSAKVDAETGEFEIGPCPPGEWRLWVHAPDRADATVPRRRLGPNERWEVGTIRLEPPGWLEVDAQRSDGKPLPDGATFQAWRAETETGQILWAQAGRVQRTGLASGTWVVWPSGADYACESFEVRVTSGAITNVRVELRPGIAQRVSLTLPDGDDARTVDVGVRVGAGGQTGRQVLRSRVWRQGTEHTLAWPLSLAPGEYELAASTAAGHRGKARLVVTDGKPAEPVTIEVK